jgi:hypothetical protein
LRTIAKYILGDRAMPQIQFAEPNRYELSGKHLNVDEPLQNVGLDFGNIGFEFRPYFGNIGFEFGLKRRQIRLRGKILMARFPQGFGERLGLLGREMAFIPQCAREAKGVEEKGTHRRNMKRDQLKVQQRRGLNLRHEIGYRVQPKKILEATRSKRNAG